jgi:6-phosphogluconolactonase/glucosamine-6-phosphate isomerase/deaminase
VKTVDNGKVQGHTVTFTIPSMMNGRELTITWRGELKDDRLTFKRQLGAGPEMPPVVLHRPAK